MPFPLAAAASATAIAARLKKMLDAKRMAEAAARVKERSAGLGPEKPPLPSVEAENAARIRMHLAKKRADEAAEAANLRESAAMRQHLREEGIPPNKVGDVPFVTQEGSWITGPRGSGMAKGGSVRGSGCATKGVKKCKIR